MQTPEPTQQIPPHINTPNMNTPQPNAPRKSKLGLFVALGCGLPLLGVLFLIVVGSLVGDDKTTNSASNKSTPVAKTGDEAAATKAALPRYIGQWTGADGTSLWIRGDGKGDFNGGNTKVEGGGVTINESDKKLAITSFFGIGKTWKLDAAPTSKNGQSEMMLNGVVYRRTGGFDASAPQSGSTPAGAFDENAPPSTTEQKRLVRETLTAFDKAVGTKDFTAFHSASSQAWRKQTTPAEMRAAFKEFIDKKIRITKTIQALPASIKSAKVEDGLLIMQGTYASAPNKTHFKLRYLPENGAWKLGSIQVKLGDPITD